MKKVFRIAIELLITFDTEWNIRYSDYACKECFWLDLGLGEVHPGAPECLKEKTRLEIK